MCSSIAVAPFPVVNVSLGLPYWMTQRENIPIRAESSVGQQWYKWTIILLS